MEKQLPEYKPICWQDAVTKANSEIRLVYEVHSLKYSNNGSKICNCSQCDFSLDQIVPVLVEDERGRNKAQKKASLCPEAYIPRVTM